MPAQTNGGVVYFIDDEAVDISRMTGIPWSWQRVYQRGDRHPYIEVSALPLWDQWRVAWAWIGAQVWLRCST